MKKYPIVWYVFIGFLGIAWTLMGSGIYGRENLPLLGILYVVLETVLTIVISCLIFFTIPHFTYPSFLSIFSVIWALIGNTCLILLIEYFLSPKPHTFLWKDMERFPVFLFASVFSMLPLVITVSYSTIQIIRMIREERGTPLSGDTF